MKRHIHPADAPAEARAVLDYLINEWLDDTDGGQGLLLRTGLAKDEARAALYDLIYVGAVVIQTDCAESDDEIAFTVTLNPKIATSRKVRREIEARMARMNAGTGRTWASLQGPRP
jgi:hypothetical protein